MIDKRYRDEAHDKYKNIIDKAFSMVLRLFK